MDDKTIKEVCDFCPSTGNKGDQASIGEYDPTEADLPDGWELLGDFICCPSCVNYLMSTLPDKK